MIGVLEGQDVAVFRWAQQNFGIYPIPPNRAIGIMDDGELVGGAIFQHFNGVNVELSYYGTDTITIGVARYIAWVAFYQLKAARITLNVPRPNKKLIRGLIKLGAVREGNCRRFYGPTDASAHTAVRMAFFAECAERFLRRSNVTRH